jgi:glutamyl-tRNA synthetase
MGPSFAGNLSLAKTALESLPPAEWEADRLLATLKGVAESHSLKLGDVMQPVRVALTGSTVSEPVNELLVIVGPETSLKALSDATRNTDGGVERA